MDKKAEIGLDHSSENGGIQDIPPMGEAERRNQNRQARWTYEQFFAVATRGAARPEGAAPYDYQCRLACGEKQAAVSRVAWLERGTGCASKLIEIPTGLGFSIPVSRFI